MKGLSIFTVLLVIGISFLVAQTIPSALAGSAGCGFNERYPDRFDSITAIQVAPRQFVLGGKDISQDKIVVGTSVNFDATPVNANNQPTNTRNPAEEPVWTISGPGTFLIDDSRKTSTGALKDKCFLPRVLVNGTGPITVTITMGSVSASATVSVGGTLQSPNPGGTTAAGGSADPAEVDTQCAYKLLTDQICVDGTRGSNQKECDVNAVCKTKAGGCKAVNPVDCRPEPNAATSKTINDPAASDLGVVIKKVFDFSLTIVGLTVFVMVIYGGFLMLLAGGMPSMHSQGKQIITNAFLGALLLFAAYVILNTINPNLVRQKGALPQLPNQQVPR